MSVDKFAIIDVTALAPRDQLLRAAKTALHDNYNYHCWETTEKVMADLREAIRCVELEPGEGGWIVWAGGACPTEPDAIVDISRASGQIETNVVAGHYHWGHVAISAQQDITSFRLVSGEWRKP